jgi:hypothetical protein
MNVTAIADRIYAINGTISGVKAQRTFPQRFDMLPLLVCLPGRSTRDSARIGAGRDEQTRVFRLLLVVEAWMAGIPTESAQKRAESLIDTVTAAYLARPRLELDGAPLDGVTRVSVGGDSGIIAFAGRAAVEFPLTITYIRGIG